MSTIYKNGTYYGQAGNPMPAADMEEVLSPLPGVMSRRIKYSTDEQIVGEWIDGKPLYQKVVNCGNKNLSSSWTTLCTISNVDTPISLEILRAEGTTYKDTLLSNGGFNAVFDNSGAVKLRYTVSSTYIVIAKYTKTTD